jgi:cyclic pyranopterin phosphate synthase
MMHSTGTKKFKIVGGEPTLRGDLVQIIQTLRAIGSDIDVSMVTNGSRLQRHVREFQDAGLNRVNVSLYTLDRQFFQENVGALPLFDATLKGIDASVELGLCGKINHVYQDRSTLLDVLAFARDRRVRVNVLNKIPSMSDHSAMPVSELLLVLQDLPIDESHLEDDPYSLPVRVMTLGDGTELEIKHLELGLQDRFNSCISCGVRGMCKEGIFAVRLTPDGSLQPCIVRDDNSLRRVAQRTKRELTHYLRHL